MKRSEWEQNTAWLPLHNMNWQQLRDTVRFERSRRAWAWGEMARRSAEARRIDSRHLRNFRRDHA